MAVGYRRIDYGPRKRGLLRLPGDHREPFGPVECDLGGGHDDLTEIERLALHWFSDPLHDELWRRGLENLNLHIPVKYRVGMIDERRIVTGSDQLKPI
jgi:hypothetical protein